MGQSLLIGAVGGAILVFMVPLLEKLHIDDVVGAIPAHLGCGVWGTMVVPFTNPETSFLTQLIGVLAIGAFTVITSASVWLALKHTMGVRPTQRDESMGLDHAELGLEVYADWGSDPFRKGARD